MTFGLPTNIIEKINSVFKKYPEIEKVVIYGSRAKGNHRAGSDIDITLFGNNITELIHSRVCSDIDDLNTPYLLDISIHHLLTSEDLLEHISRVGIEFYSKK